MVSAYHSKLFAHEITRLNSSESVDMISRSLFDASVDLNPHQIDAALFALKNPLSKGVILADEVGLGKTIEASLILSQFWAERKRKLLIIAPASLRKQWSNELREKFNLASVILDSQSYKDEFKKGNKEPFVQNGIIIASYNYAIKMRFELSRYNWDLVVIDEAHRLRNVYKDNNKTSKELRSVLSEYKKILLTATPLQNSLMELYGISTFVDERIFGDARSFKTLYVSRDADLEELRSRISVFCQRTLRKQVLEYVKYTKRKPITITFEPDQPEIELYESVSNFLREESTYAIPQRSRHLMTLLVRKILASSTEAVISTLNVMRDRLINLQRNDSNIAMNLDNVLQDTELEDDEVLEQADDVISEDLVIHPEKLKIEISKLEFFIELAKKVHEDSRAISLLKALEVGFKELSKMGASRKALIFTESRKTQNYLLRFLEANGFKDKIVLFNGTNDASKSKDIYKRWLDHNKTTGRISGSKSADVRNSLVEYFRDEAEIMIATESAAEGVNLQFCSMLINYDLPWNPQRVEQRIGRCHRYGQKFDVVVVNFVNNKNQADIRVHQLLSEKCQLFDGVFGASDSVLGSLESGIDFEKKIFEIYQGCRTSEEINRAFDQLQVEMEDSISQRMEETKDKLLKNFDEDIHTKLKAHKQKIESRLDILTEMFWNVSKFELSKFATFDDEKYQFELSKQPTATSILGNYHLITKDKEKLESVYLYRLGHQLGEYCLNISREKILDVKKLSFDLSSTKYKVSIVEKLKGKKGMLRVSKLKIISFREEEFLIYSARTDNNEIVDQEVVEKFFKLSANESSCSENLSFDLLNDLENKYVDSCSVIVEKNNQIFFENEIDRLDKWADDIKNSLEIDIKEIDKEIRALKKESKKDQLMDDKVKLLRHIKELESKRSAKRRSLYEEQDRIEDEKESIISGIEKRKNVKKEIEKIFEIEWEIN